MGKYSRSYMREPPLRKPWEVHPVWRGIGCVFLVLVPILSYAGAVLLVRENLQQRWVQIPAELMGSIIVPGVGRIYYMDVAVAVILMVVGFGLLIVLYAMVYNAIAPPYYGPLDAPPVSYRKRRRK